MPYTFNTILLSAQKTGTPNLIGTSLSGTAVTFLSGSGVQFNTKQLTVVSLSTNDAGIVFTPTSVSVGATSLSTFNLTAYPSQDITVLGSVFSIPNVLHGQTLAVVKVPSGNIKTYTLFVHNSALTTVPSSAITLGETDVSDPEVRRKWLLGYV